MQKKSCSKLKLDLKCTLGKLLVNHCHGSPFSTPETPLSSISTKSFWQNDIPSPTNSDGYIYNLEQFVKTKVIGDSSFVESEFKKLKCFDNQLSRSKGLFCFARKFPHKNRFSSVLANESSRVKLSRDTNLYINANHIEGSVFNVPQNYVACQAPLPGHHGEFWEMIYDQNSRIIVMLANEINESTSNEPDCPFATLEKRRRVDKYWPNENETLNFGPITVEGKSVSVLQKDMIILREFNLSYEGNDSRTIYHMQFFGWPDMSVPSVDPFMGLISCIDSYSENLRALNPFEKSGPIVLHCVAGVGRTGTLAAIHIALTQLKRFMQNQTNDSQYFAFNICNIVQELKKARVGMVQELDQYKFIYTTILEGCRRLNYKFPDSMDIDYTMHSDDSNSSSLNSMDSDFSSNRDMDSCSSTLNDDGSEYNEYMSPQGLSNAGFMW